MKVLAIAAHPDDETLGCGGTLLKHKAAGDNIFWLIATEAYSPKWPQEVILEKSNEVSDIAEAYGMENYFKLGFHSGQLDTIPFTELMDRVQDVITKVSPDTVYLVHHRDVHTDHQILFTAAMSVLKPIHMATHGVKRVVSFETLSSTEAAVSGTNSTFSPNIFGDITPYMERKIDILEMYKSESQHDPLPRGPSALRALARVRGATIGVEYAEAFMLVRELT